LRYRYQAFAMTRLRAAPSSVTLPGWNRTGVSRVASDLARRALSLVPELSASASARSTFRESATNCESATCAGAGAVPAIERIAAVMSRRCR
jgi:hypothetical protein